MCVWNNLRKSGQLWHATSPRRLGGQGLHSLPMIDQLTTDVFVQQAGGQCLVLNAFFEDARLQVFKIAAGNADVQALVFLEDLAD